MLRLVCARRIGDERTFPKWNPSLEISDENSSPTVKKVPARAENSIECDNTVSKEKIFEIHNVISLTTTLPEGVLFPLLLPTQLLFLQQPMLQSDHVMPSCL